MPSKIDLEVDEIRDRFNAMMAAAREGSHDVIVDTFTDDGALLSPGRAIIGHKALQASWAAFVERPVGSFDCTISEIVVAASGDLAYQTGDNRLREAGAPTQHSRYVFVWRKVDGDWRIALDMICPVPAAGL